MSEHRARRLPGRLEENMKIKVTYKVPTADGFWDVKAIILESFEEANRICEKCDEIGYPVIDVTREE